MASASIKSVGGDVISKLNEMIEKGKSNRAFLARIAYPMYQARQMKRWITENASEGQPWSALNPTYKEWKRINYAGFPGNGERMLILTGALFGSVTGRNTIGNPTEVVVDESGKTTLTGSLGGGTKGHNVMVTEQSLIVASDLEYSKYVNEKRPFWNFKEEFYREIKQKYVKWFVGANG